MFEVVYDKQDGSGFPVTIISFYAVRQIFKKKKTSSTPQKETLHNGKT